MYFLLNDRYSLCGWEKLPFALTDRLSGEVRFLPKRDFLLLYRCDGRHLLLPETMTEEERALLDQWLSAGLIRICTDPVGTDEMPVYREYPARFKASAQWSVTGSCNCSCRHCLLSAPENAMEDMATSDCLEIIRQLGECGIRRVSLTGGEALLRPDFFRLLDALTEQEISVTTVYTNGLLISDSLLKRFEDRKLRPLFQMSYDGHGMHDWLRGLSGAEDAVLRAFVCCREHGFHTSAAMCLHRRNTDCLAESVRLLASLGCSGLKVSGLRPQGNAARLEEVILSREEFFSFCLDYLPLFFEDGAPMDLMLDGLFAYRHSDRQYFIPFERDCRAKAEACLLCDHIRQSLYISPEGQVLPCMSMAGTAAAVGFPNLLQTPLRDILSRSEYLDRCDLRLSDYLAHNPECADCEDRISCGGGCRALALGNSGCDYLAKDLWTCGYFRGGWREKLHACLKRHGLPVPEESDAGKESHNG